MDTAPPFDTTRPVCPAAELASRASKPKSVSVSTKGSSRCMVFVIKTKTKCEFFIPIIFLKQDIFKMHLAQVMYFYSVNLMLGYNFLLTKYLLQKVKECKIWTFSVLLPWPSQTSQMWTEQNQLNKYCRPMENSEHNNNENFLHNLFWNLFNCIWKIQEVVLL